MCRQSGWGVFPGTSLASRTDDQVARIVAVNGTHRLPDALAPLMNVRHGAEGDKQTPNVTKNHHTLLARARIRAHMVHNSTHTHIL